VLAVVCVCVCVCAYACVCVCVCVYIYKVRLQELPAGKAQLERQDCAAACCANHTGGT